MGEKRGAYGILVRRPKERNPLGRPRRRSKNNIKMDLYGMGCEGMKLFDLSRHSANEPPVSVKY
jgi:hypothetical protein